MNDDPASPGAFDQGLQRTLMKNVIADHTVLEVLIGDSEPPSKWLTN